MFRLGSGLAGLIIILLAAVAPSLGTAALLVVDGGVVQVLRLSVDVGHVSATIDIDPNTLNPDSKGNYVMSYIELPEGFDVDDIDVSSVTIRVQGTTNSVPALPGPTEVGDYDSDGLPDRMVKFERQAVLDLIGDKSGDVTFTVAGQLGDGTFFGGSDTVDP